MGIGVFLTLLIIGLIAFVRIFCKQHPRQRPMLINEDGGEEGDFEDHPFATMRLNSDVEGNNVLVTNE